MWDMRYAWNLVPHKYSSWKLTEIDPFPNPVLVGCSLAIGRRFFDHIGELVPVHDFTHLIGFISGMATPCDYF